MTFPALQHLSAGYFHQDWIDMYEDELAVVDDFVDGSPANAPLLPAEIDMLLQQDDASIAAVLMSLHLEYKPENGDYRAWLTEVARRVREQLR